MRDLRALQAKARLEVNLAENALGRALYALDALGEALDDAVAEPAPVEPEPIPVEPQPVPAEPDPIVVPAPSPAEPAPTGSKEWNKLKLGAGGFIAGLQITDDDTKIAWGDVHNAYILDKGESEWRELITIDSMPAGTIPIGDTYNQHKKALGLEHKGDGAGVWAAAAAPSDSNRIYVDFYGDLWRSDNRGYKFKPTGFPSRYGKANHQAFAGGERLMSPKLAVDPANPDHVWSASHLGDGTWFSADGGDTAQRLDVTMVPDAVDAAGVIGPHIILFDRTSPVVDGKTQRIYIGVYGKGIYKTENAGDFEFIGGPKTFRTLTCDTFGRLWVGDTIKGNPPQWFTPDAGWTVCGGSHNVPYYSIAANPLDRDHIVLYANYAQNVQSFDGGNTWSSWWSADHFAFDDSDGVPWISNSNRAGMSIAQVAFDSEGSLWGAHGMGVFQTPAPLPRDRNTQKFMIKEMSRGLNLLCIRHINKVPGGALMVAALDRSIIPLHSMDEWAKSYGPDSGLHNGHHSAYSPFDPSYVAFAVTKRGKFHGYSPDGGKELRVFEGVGQMSSAPAGSIAVSMPNNVIHVPGSNGVPRYTLDGGKRWTKLPIPGLPDADGGDMGFGFSPWSGAVAIAADTVRPGVFYLYSYGTKNPDGTVKTAGGIWLTEDGGPSWRLVHARPQAWDWASWHFKVLAAPGHEGHVFFVPGADTGHPAWRCVNGISDQQEWTEITGTYNGAPAKFFDVYDLSFGKGTGDYPAVGILGTLNGEFGVFVSQDNCDTWEKIAAHPAQSIDQPYHICGDMEVAGQWYASFGASGGAYTTEIAA